jgi:FkbM family methyltransferase
MDRGLIYDVGVHTGEDTGYYLHKGLRVVGIEANPTMCESLRERFAEALADGRLTLLNVGIADEAGELEFYVCDDVSEWSSFDRSFASRDGARHHAVTVETRPFSDILAEHGTPWYCKIDIEGHDRLCLEGLQSTEDRPRYVSLEIDPGSAGADVELLLELGYSRFKIISQTTHAQPRPIAATVNGALPTNLSSLLRRVERKLRGRGSDGSWTYPPGSSGAFGEYTAGPWHDAEATLALCRHLHKLEGRRRQGPVPDWYDIHAAGAA